MIESRCGLLCSSFNCKEAFGFDCQGCAKEKNIPWGQCDVKICCEAKGHEHCGLCGEFPCEVLTRFSYDETHGDNGERIEQCKVWCGQNEGCP